MTKPKKRQHTGDVAACWCHAGDLARWLKTIDRYEHESVIKEPKPK